MTADSLLTYQGLAEALGVSARTIRRMYLAKDIPAEIAHGKIYRFDLSKVKAALAAKDERKPGNGIRIRTIP